MFMKNILLLYFMLVSNLFCFSRDVSSTVRFFVAPSGSDRNAGSLKNPFLTFERAQRAVRQAKKPGVTAIEVLVRGGDYYLCRPLVFRMEDGGCKTVSGTYALKISDG